MYKTELEYVKKRIHILDRNRYLKDKNIYLFGVSDNTRQIVQILRTLGYKPLQIIDNDKQKHNSFCSMLKVVALKDVKVNRNTIIFIYSSFWKEMYFQLMEIGFQKQQIHILFKEDRILWKGFYESYLGRKIYKRLIKKYGTVPIFLCPYTGTGDIYLIGTFWKEYLSNHKIENYVFVVISEACKKVASLFEIKNVEVLRNQKECKYLIQYYILCPTEIDLKLLNDDWPQIVSNSSEWFRGYKGMYFMELFRKFVFDLPDTSFPKPPQLRNMSDELERLFTKNGLIEKRTVILSPYSNTLADLPEKFWEKIVTKLKEKGYIICTNSSGKQEPAIIGSIPIFFPLNIAPQFVEKAGIFIGVRSGFCDVISASKAKKIILYDAENRFYNSSAFEYFSLNHMGLCRDAIEIEYRYLKLDETISKTIEYICDG